MVRLGPFNKTLSNITTPQEGYPLGVLSSSLPSVCIGQWWRNGHRLSRHGLQWPPSEPFDSSCEGSPRTWEHKKLGCPRLQVPSHAALAVLVRLWPHHPTLHLNIQTNWTVLNDCEDTIKKDYELYSAESAFNMVTVKTSLSNLNFQKYKVQNCN